MSEPIDELTKLTVNLIPRSVAALDAAALTTGDSRSDVVNRALQLYAATVSRPFKSFRWDAATNEFAEYDHA